MKFETIDSDQIADIMEGRDPRPPKGWGDDSGDNPGGNAPSAKAKENDKAEKPIGGPAGQH